MLHLLVLAAAAVTAPLATVAVPLPSGDIAPGRVELPPAPPLGAARNLTIPVKDDAGSYRTPNQGIPAAEAIWHVRSALNVAALGCRGVGEDATVAAYNALITNDAALFAKADAETQAAFEARIGAGWRDVHDVTMTRVYNFFALPPAHDGFCAAAKQVLGETAAMTPEAFAAFTPAALARLEAPFVAFFASYGAYRVQLAAWQQRQGNAPLMMAASAPVATDSPAHVLDTPVPPPAMAAFRGPIAPDDI